ncbi:MAG: hypothetical protein KBG92_02045 [Spirochaetes bacterium]|nr:hypothetical protein [Spirochaetota bacterium]MBP8986562.1 hypothetical protein [Spirochaetota bacterium]
MNKVVFIFLIVLIFCNATTAFSKEVPFTLEDRDRIIRLEAKLDEIDKRFEQMDKRFEQIDKRFEQVISFLWILTTIFIAITSATIGFAFWDRKTSLKPIEEKVTINEKKLEHALAALRKLASVDKKVHAILKEFNLL